VQEMEDCWPSGVALRGEASNHPKLRWLKTVVVSVGEKAHKMCQVGTGKTCQSVLAGVVPGGASLLKRRKDSDGIETESIYPLSGPSLAGARVLARRCPA
jgi:hypothetical protein